MSKTAVVYLRRSSDKQDASISDQRSTLRQYAEKHGYKIVREYVDGTTTPATGETLRPSFVGIRIALAGSTAWKPAITSTHYGRLASPW
jgi:hypothetical protein